MRGFFSSSNLFVCATLEPDYWAQLSGFESAGSSTAFSITLSTNPWSDSSGSVSGPSIAGCEIDCVLTDASAS